MEQADRLHVVDRGDWPYWPWLPLKRRVGVGMAGLQCAVLHADDGTDPLAPVKVYNVNVHQLAACRCFFPTSVMPVAQEYPSWQAFLESDWEVD